MLWHTHVNAQENKKRSYSLELSITPLASVHIGPPQFLTGAAGHKSNNYIGGQIRGVYKYTERWSFGTGLGYSTQKVTTTPPLVNPSIGQSTYSSSLHIWEIPMEARLTFFKHFYANAGTLIHVQQNANQHIDKQNGLGINIGAGVNVPLSSKLAVSISPHYKMSSLVPFQSKNHHDRTQLLGIGIGIRMY